MSHSIYFLERTLKMMKSIQILWALSNKYSGFFRHHITSISFPRCKAPAHNTHGADLLPSVHRTRERGNRYRRERLQGFLPTFGFFQIGFQRAFYSWSQRNNRASRAQPTCSCCPRCLFLLVLNHGGGGCDCTVCPPLPSRWELGGTGRTPSLSYLEGSWNLPRPKSTAKPVFLEGKYFSFIVVFQ